MLFARKKSGMTLIEVLIAVSLFAIVSTLSGRVLMDVVQLEKKSSIQNVFYEDVKLILQQLTNEIQTGAIDYEEYYNRYVIHNNNCDGIIGPCGYFGVNYGVYAGRFYAPGKSLYNTDTFNPDDLGVECSYPKGNSPDDCDIFYTLATDLNTGQNPFESSGSVPEYSNALCDDPAGSGCEPAANPDIGHVTELYLIDSTGMQKTIIASKKMPGSLDDAAIGMVKMEGMDLDQNGVIDTWKCQEEYYCENLESEILSAIKHPYINSTIIAEQNILLPAYENLSTPFDPFANEFSHFVPITPRRSSIKDMSFIIHPIEDPYKAFGEEDVQAHPSVTIILTIGLSEEAAADYPGDFTPITVQTTVTAGVLGKINSYPPTNDVSWMDGDLATGNASPMTPPQTP